MPSPGYRSQFAAGLTLEIIWGKSEAHYYSSAGPKVRIRLPPAESSYASVRQLAGRKGEVWGAESAADKLFMIKSE